MVQVPDLNSYMDYRKYLADFYAYKREITKKDLRPYSYQMFSAAANIKSPQYLRLIIDGKRNLSGDMVGKFAKALSLNKEQSDQLKMLVQFTQATDPAERNRYLKELMEMRVSQKIKSGEIDSKTFEKIPGWVTWILYSMVDQKGVNFDPQQLKQLLGEKATLEEITESLEKLLESGELKKDELTGEIKKARPLMENADNIPVALVRKLQAELLYLGMESLFQDDPMEREFGTVTLSLTEKEFEEIKFKLRQMRKQLTKDNSIARAQAPGERIYQLNIQLFPVTKAAQDSKVKTEEKMKSLLQSLVSQADLKPVESP
ncbi:MAG: TIGR02147 family protein [Bdellovibrionales bacterium]